MVSDRLSTAVKSPNRLVTFSNWMYGFAFGSFHGAKSLRMLPSDFMSLSVLFPGKTPATQPPGFTSVDAYWPVTTLVQRRVMVRWVLGSYGATVNSFFSIGSSG